MIYSLTGNKERGKNGDNQQDNAGFTGIIVSVGAHDLNVQGHQHYNVHYEILVSASSCTLSCLRSRTLPVKGIDFIGKLSKPSEHISLNMNGGSTLSDRPRRR